MAMDSVKKMRQYVKTPELNRLLEAYGEKHRRLEGEIADQLESFGESESAPGKMAEVMAKAEMNMRMFLHPDDEHVARIMMDGCNMGIQSVSDYVNKHPDASRESRDIAGKIIKIEEDFMQEMKGFV